MRLALLTLLTLGSTLSASADGLRDPTRPPLAESHGAVPREAAPILTAVMTFKGARSAIFNGHLVHDGTAVGSYTIEAVLEDGVRFRHAGVVQELRLPRPTSTIKKPAAEPDRAASGAQ